MTRLFKLKKSSKNFLKKEKKYGKYPEFPDKKRKNAEFWAKMPEKIQKKNRKTYNRLNFNNFPDFPLQRRFPEFARIRPEFRAFFLSILPEFLQNPAEFARNSPGILPNSVYRNTTIFKKVTFLDVTN